MFVLLLLVSIILSVGMGAVFISPLQVLSILADSMGMKTSIAFTETQSAVLTAIRLPRVLLAILVGGSLAISGASLQGLFRNPLADPSLIGISSGASLAAVACIVLGLNSVSGWNALTNAYSLSIITFGGALATAIVVYRLSQSGGKTIISTMLLAGIAINALTGAFTGVFTYAASDVQLRSITFWMLGSLGGATWNNVIGILPFTLIPILLLPSTAKSLNTFSLGEHNASHLGTNTERVKAVVILLTTLCVGASVAVTGVIGFIGLIVPHILRLLMGPDHRHLLYLSALLGAIVLVSADLAARTLFVPTELPIGILTSLIGAPVFLYIVIKERKAQKIF